MSHQRSRVRSAFLHTTPSDQLPWWWEDIRLDRQLCDIDYLPLKFRGKRSKQITTLELPLYLFKLLRELFRLRKYDYVFTGECDLNSLGIALWQSLFLMRRPRHVILQFIMREKTPQVSSRLKYALMTFMFRSVYRVVCSSRTEAEYYRQVFGWDADKAQFVPLLTSPRCVEHGDAKDDERYVVAAGRVFRDYPTVIEAVRGTPFKLIIIGGAGVSREIAAGDQVEVLEEIPNDEFVKLLRRATAVVVPLVDKRISTGQTVVLQAMAMGKLVIATRTAGTEDYIDHMVDGLLVAPGDVEEMRRAIDAAGDAELRAKLGSNARDRMSKGHMPHHYSAGIRRAVLRPATVR
jgi:glycosyltransferase involved in cell wall biosynthesis